MRKGVMEMEAGAEGADTAAEEGLEAGAEVDSEVDSEVEEVAITSGGEMAVPRSFASQIQARRYRWGKCFFSLSTTVIAAHGYLN